MNNSNTNNNRGLLRLTSEYLYIANDGYSFDRKGVIAICMQNLSSKENKIKDDNIEVSDEKWIEAINKSQLKLYKNHQNRLQADHKEERSTAKDYSGRWLFEILQNIDDAIGSKNTHRFIGTKGLGFLSVLEIAKEPAIFSNPFNFKFSKQNTQQALIELEIDEEQSKLTPLFQVPWPCRPDNTTDEILKDGYATVIRFKIKPENYKIVSKEITEMDHHFLLFSQHMQIIKIITDKFEQVINKKETIIYKDEIRSKSMIRLHLEHTDKKKEIKEWIKWQRNWESEQETEKYSSSMFCLPYKDGQCIPFETVTKIYNFYPTDECSEIRGFLHVTFKLSGNRKYLKNWSEQNDFIENVKSPNEDKKLIEETCKLIIDDVINDEHVPAETVIICFSELNNVKNLNGEVNKPLKHIQIKLLESIKKCKFVPIFGGTLSALFDIKIWRHNLLDCLLETSQIQKLNLASKLMLPCFENISKFGCTDVGFAGMSNILANHQIKNATKSDRKILCEVISQYGKEYSYTTLTSATSENFLSIPFLDNIKNEIISLNDDDYIISNKFSSPSFIKIGHLSNSSHKNLTDYFVLENNLHDDLLKLIKNKLISTKNEFVRYKIGSEIINADNLFWKQNGFEVISYLFNFYIEDKEKFLLNSRNFLNYIFIPEKLSFKWENSKKGYFSKSWNSKSNLIDWFKINANKDEFLIVEFERLIIELKKFNIFDLQENIEKNNNTLKKDLIEFLLIIGVRQTPPIRKVNDWSDFNYLYILYLDQENYNSFQTDYMFNNIEMFINHQIRREAFKSVSIMAIEAKKLRSVYFKKYSKKILLPVKYKNFAIFQLQSIRWLKLKQSPIRPNGLFSPDECHISNINDPLFPQVSKSEFEFLSHHDADQLIENLNFNLCFSPTNAIWINWISAIPNGYQQLLDEGIDTKTLNIQIQFFYRSLFSINDSDIKITDDMLIPVYSCKINDHTYEFISLNKTVWNDTSVDDGDLRDALKELGLGLFILGNLDGIETESLSNFGINRVTDHIDFHWNFSPIDENTRSGVVSFIENHWALLSALDIEFENNENETNFFEFEKNLTMCTHIDISIRAREEKFMPQTKTYILNYYEHLQDKEKKLKDIYIQHDKQNLNLIWYICNKLFKWVGRFSLVKELLLYNNDELQINLTLKQNNLNPNLVEYFTILLADITNLGLEDNVIKQKSQIHHFDDNSIFNKNDKNNIDNQLQTHLPIPNNKNSKSSSEISDSLLNSNSFNSELLKKENVSSFTSGRMRALHDNENIYRNYFDEDATQENMDVGELAEKHVFDLLKVDYDETVLLLGNSNKGFDITYQFEGDTYFVEVKGLSGSWDYTDVLLSKAQFEKAQHVGNYYIIYVVEHVIDPSKILVTQIKNPASLFTKMQLDYGWRNLIG